MEELIKGIMDKEEGRAQSYAETVSDRVLHQNAVKAAHLHGFEKGIRAACQAMVDHLN